MVTLINISVSSDGSWMALAPPWRASTRGHKRYRLSWLTNSALVYEPKCWGVQRGLSQWVKVCTWSPTPKLWRFKTIYLTSVPDPDPHGFGPPVSGSISQRYGSRSFYQQSKNSKALILIVLWIPLDFLSLKNDVNVPSKSIKQKNFVKKLVFCWHLEGQWRK